MSDGKRRIAPTGELSSRRTAPRARPWVAGMKPAHWAPFSRGGRRRPKGVGRDLAKPPTENRQTNGGRRRYGRIQGQRLGNRGEFRQAGRLGCGDNRIAEANRIVLDQSSHHGSKRTLARHGGGSADRGDVGWSGLRSAASAATRAAGRFFDLGRRAGDERALAEGAAPPGRGQKGRQYQGDCDAMKREHENPPLQASLA
jgi:hypothetical protein